MSALHRQVDATSRVNFLGLFYLASNTSLDGWHVLVFRVEPTGALAPRPARSVAKSPLSRDLNRPTDGRITLGYGIDTGSRDVFNGTTPFQNTRSALMAPVTWTSMWIE